MDRMSLSIAFVLFVAVVKGQSSNFQNNSTWNLTSTSVSWNSTNNVTNETDGSWSQSTPSPSPLNRTCRFNNDCGPWAHCLYSPMKNGDLSSRCVCLYPRVWNSTLGCVLNHTEPSNTRTCNNNYECGDNAYCNSGNCQCVNGFHWARFGCVWNASALKCYSSEDGECGENAYCDLEINYCICKQGYRWTESGCLEIESTSTSSPLPAINCEDDSDCGLNGFCNSNTSSCDCFEGYRWSLEANECVRNKTRLYAECQYDGQCGENAQCVYYAESTYVCKCPSYYVAADNLIDCTPTIRPLFAPCELNTQCGSNAVCLNNYCSCSIDYTANEDGINCNKAHQNSCSDDSECGLNEYCSPFGGCQCMYDYWRDEDGFCTTSDSYLSWGTNYAAGILVIMVLFFILFMIIAMVRVSHRRQQRIIRIPVPLETKPTIEKV